MRDRNPNFLLLLFFLSSSSFLVGEDESTRLDQKAADERRGRRGFFSCFIGVFNVLDLAALCVNYHLVPAGDSV